MAKSGPSRSNRPRKRHKARAAALGLIALAIIIVVVSLTGRDDDSKSDTSKPTLTTASPTTTSAPETTEAATSAAETTKPPAAESATSPELSAPADKTDSNAQTDPKPTGINVLITSSEWNAQDSSIEVVGDVQGVATDSSTCTAVATSGSVSTSATVDGTFDGQGTSCGLISVPMAGLQPGNYSVVIKFESDHGSAQSAAVTVTVP